jgi:ribonuclease HI
MEEIFFIQMVLSSATTAIGDYKGALESDISLREPEGISLSSRILNWCPPSIGFFKANWDAAINSKKGILGFGCIVWDVHGFVVAALSHSVIVMGNPEVAEALAALHTIEFCRNHGFNSIILEGDSLIVVNAINRVGLNWSFLENIILDIQTLLKEFLYWKVCYTPRGTNIAAHSLVKEGVIQGGNRIWLGCIPNCIKTIVLSECSSLVF